jgi:hypothetical protein
MPSNDLIPLMSNQTVSFSTASESAFATPFSPALLWRELETSSQFPGFSLFMETQLPTGRVDYWVSLRIPGTEGGVELPEDTKYRLRCFYFLAALPENALREAAESLGSIWEYYRVPFVSVPALPSSPTQVVELGQSYVRPTFHVSEDD